jgi:hypothetical protein
MRPTTGSQKFARSVSGEHLRADITVGVTQESADSPQISQCRHAVLTIQTTDAFGTPTTGHVVYDRLLCRIVNGVFAENELEGALIVAQRYNSDPNSPQDMSPNGEALGLTYPDGRA